MFPSMKRLAVSSDPLLSLLSGRWLRHPGAREVSSAFYLRSSEGKRVRPPAFARIRWVRAPSSRRPSTAAKETYALTHPSNLRETGALVTGPVAQAGSGVAITRGRQDRGSKAGSRIEDGAVTKERIEDAGHAAGG